MPQEIHAEDIEKFLGTVDGVGSARLLTSPSGEIDQIYVAADAATESRAVRRAVVAALMTAYGIPIEPWRIQVTRLRDGLRPAEMPNVQVVRVEETVSSTEVTARVQVAWDRAGERRTGTGQARGPAGATHRLRILALATIDALRAVLEPAHRRVAVQQVALTSFLDHPVVLVGITVNSPRAAEVFIGVAPQQEGTLDAAVIATLDAVTKWILHTATAGPAPAVEGDRRARLEAMRHFVRSGGGVQSGSRTTPDVGAQPSASPGGQSPPPNGEDRQPEETVPPPADGWRTESRGPGEVIPMRPDILGDLHEIRPEQKGGAVMTAHHEGSRVGIAPSRATRPAVEDEFYLPLIEARTPLHIRCRDGYEVTNAILRDVGTYTLLVEAGGGTELVYKHAIISIRPRVAPA
jgi:sRNA-binding regulator protein Hfq